MDKQLVAELYSRFVWRDAFGSPGYSGIGWSQSLSLAEEHLRIWSASQPPTTGFSEHGIDVTVISKCTCLISLRYSDGQRAGFIANTTIKHIAEILLADGCPKIGPAANGLIDYLDAQNQLIRTQVIGCV